MEGDLQLHHLLLLEALVLLIAYLGLLFIPKLLARFFAHFKLPKPVASSSTE